MLRSFLCKRSLYLSSTSGKSKELTVGEEKRDLFLKYFSFNKNIANDRFRCPYCYNSFNFFSRSDAAEEKLAQTSSYLQDCLSKQLFIEKHKVTSKSIILYIFIKTEILQKQVSLFLAYSFKNHMMSLLRQFFSQTMH
jgi:hypothetical protein